MTRERQQATRKHSAGSRPEALKKSRLTWIVPLGLLGMLVALYFLWPTFRTFTGEAYGHLTSGNQRGIERWVGSFGLWGPAVILLAMVLQALLAFIPSVLLMVVCVLAYGPLWGGLLAWGGVLLAALVAYSVGRTLGPVTVDKLIGHETEQKISRYLERYGVWTIVAARISPVFSDDAVSYAAGLMGMGFYRFLVATALGVLPLVALIALLGGDLGRLQWGLVVISVLSMAAIVGHAVYEHHKGDGDGRRRSRAVDD